MVFFRRGYWNELPFPSARDLPYPGIEPSFPMSLALQADSLPAEPLEKPCTFASSFFKATLTHMKVICKIFNNIDTVNYLGPFKGGKIHSDMKIPT